MKKWIAILLTLATLATLTACGRNKDKGEESKPEMKLPETPLALLETVWNSYGENEKFPAMGGSYDEDESKNNNVDNAPGKYDITHEGLTTAMMVPADQVKNIAEAASLTHGMMTNNFTCGAYKMAQGANAKEFADAMQSSISSQRWLCGNPEALLIVKLGDNFVVAAYGLKDYMDVLQTKLSAAYPGAEVVYSKLITE